MEGQDGESQQKEDSSKKYTYPLIRVYTILFINSKLNKFILMFNLSY